MKILLVTSEFGESGGGLSFACSRFYELLTQDMGFDVKIISSTENIISTAKGGYKSSLFEHISHEYRLKTDTLSYKNENIDAIIAFGGSFNGYYASLLSSYLNTSFYLLFRGSDANLAKWDSQEIFYLLQATNNASKVVCLSNEMKKNILAINPQSNDKILVIPNILENVPQPVSIPNLPHKVVIGCTATHINEKKGIANLLYVVKAFKEKYNIPLLFHIIGNIDSDLFEQYSLIVKELDIKENVLFTQYMSREECLRTIRSWDFYIQGSICEGFCNSVAEVMMMGKSVILSPTGFISERLLEDYPWMILNDWNPDSIADKIADIVYLSKKESLYNEAYNKIYSLTKKEIVLKQWIEVLITKVPQRTINRHSGILTVALHEVDEDLYDHISTPTYEFEKFASNLYNNGYGLCSLKNYLDKSEAERNKWIVCTFDDAYIGLVKNALPILSKYKFTATVFVNSSLIGKDNSWNWKDNKKRQHLDKDGLITLHNSNWEIGSHGHTHRNLLRLSEKELEFEFSESKNILESLVGPIHSYAYPYGDSSSYSRKICSKYYHNAFSLSQGGSELKVDNMQIRRYSIDEIIKILGL